MQPEEKRDLIEVITKEIGIGKDEITLNFCYAPSCKDMAKGWQCLLTKVRTFFQENPVV